MNAWTVPLVLTAAALAAVVWAACWWHARQPRPPTRPTRDQRAREARVLAAHVDEWADLDDPDNRAIWSAAADLVWHTPDPGKDVLGR